MRWLVPLLLATVSPAQAQNACGMQLGDTAPIFCDTFAQKNPGIPSRTGDLDPNVWGVSRTTGRISFQGQFNQWASTLIQKCDGTTPRVLPPNDVVICNGQLRQASNDNVDGGFEAGGVTVLAIYPKQPFDFAGRTGTVSFDVSNNTFGSHAAWPEFWLTDLPIPAPFAFQGWISLPRHGFGIRFHSAVGPGQQGACPSGANLDKWRWTVGSAVVIRNYVREDTEGYGTPANMAVQVLDCVVASPGPNGPLNHIELKIAQNQIDVWATDAGSTALRKIAVVTNPNLSFSRGLIWIQDAHYNADKGPAPSQRENTYTWDNVAFDGPFTYRDFSFDALDNNAPGPNGSVNLAKLSAPGATTSWDVLGMPANPQAASVRVLFNFNHEVAPNSTVINVVVNGNPHSVPWPYPDQGPSWRTLGVTVPITNLVAGTNVVQIGSDQWQMTSNVNIVLVNVPGGVPVLPGSVNGYPSGPSPVNGMCGSVNGTTVPIKPTANLCAVGTASTVAGTGPWTWTCAGANGGTTASCAAQKTPPVTTCKVVNNIPTCGPNCNRIGTNAAGQMICKD